MVFYRDSAQINLENSLLYAFYYHNGLTFSSKIKSFAKNLSMKEFVLSAVKY